MRSLILLIVSMFLFVNPAFSEEEDWDEAYCYGKAYGIKEIVEQVDIKFTLKAEVTKIVDDILSATKANYEQDKQKANKGYEVVWSNFDVVKGYYGTEYAVAHLTQINSLWCSGYAQKKPTKKGLN